MVEVKIRARLEARANINSHQNCLPNKSPGNIIISFVENAQNSIILVLFQYFFSNNWVVISHMSLGFIIFIFQILIKCRSIFCCLFPFKLNILCTFNKVFNIFFYITLLINWMREKVLLAV